MHEITFHACGPCACLIVNGDASGDAFAIDPEWRGAALEQALADRSAVMPVHACPTDDEGDCGSQDDGPCAVCGDELPDVLHAMVADYVGRTYPV